jgi:transposase
MGRLSAYAKNRILKLRFKKNRRIIHIVEILNRDDNIKVSRQAVSTFLKKYLETNSIYDKPRTGRKRKLTQEEIHLIGQLTRLNRDITARAIKEYLNLNVSTYTILRATKLFEWNKVNPNSNDSKKAAAIERGIKTKPKDEALENGEVDTSNLNTNKQDVSMNSDLENSRSFTEKSMTNSDHNTTTDLNETTKTEPDDNDTSLNTTNGHQNSSSNGKSMNFDKKSILLY